MNRFHAFSLSLCLLAATTAHAQRPGGGMPPPPGPDMQGPDHRGPGGPGLGIVPPGTFWRNPETIKLLGLNADQQKQMDSIFHDSRVQLIQLHAALDEEQLNLEPLLNATPFDQGKAFAEISKIADLRANLEKADAKMLLGLRGVLTADQWTKFQTSIRSHQPGQEGGHSRRSHEGPGGPTDPTGPRGGGSNQTPPPPPSGDENFVEQPQ